MARRKGSRDKKPRKKRILKARDYAYLAGGTYAGASLSGNVAGLAGYGLSKLVSRGTGGPPRLAVLSAASLGGALTGGALAYKALRPRIEKRRARRNLEDRRAGRL